MKREKPKFMITYLCLDCGFDFAITEKDKPKCFYCDSTKNYKEISKKKLSLKVIVDRMKLCNDRMEQNLKAAYKIRPEDEVAGVEDNLLKALVQTKELKNKINDLNTKND